MPVKKFRTLEEMEDSLWRQPGDPQLWRAIASVWSFAEQTCPRHFPPGVYRHCTIEEAESQRDVWEEANLTIFAKSPAAAGPATIPRIGAAALLIRPSLAKQKCASEQGNGRPGVSSGGR